MRGGSTLSRFHGKLCPSLPHRDLFIPPTICTDKGIFLVLFRTSLFSSFSSLFFGVLKVGDLF